jgi:hypothetical protein
VLIDTPGGDTGAVARGARQGDLIVTPMNDSFVDFDMLGQVDPVTLDLLRPSLYSETVWNARKMKMMTERRSVDWVVMRNRLATTEAKNRRRVEERLTALARRVGFRVGPGLRDRVIYRELFPFGLSIADLSAKVRPVAMSLGPRGGSPGAARGDRHAEPEPRRARGVPDRLVILLLAALAAFALLVWVGRGRRLGREWRPVSAVVAAMAFTGAAVAGVRSEWLLCAGLVVAGSLLSLSARRR